MPNICRQDHNWYMWPFFTLSFEQNMFCFSAACANRTCQEHCVMLLQNWMALEVNIPPDVAQTVKTCFVGHRTRVSWTACGCELCSVTPTCNAAWLEEKGRLETQRKTFRSGRERTSVISPMLDCMNNTKQERGSGKWSATCSQSSENPQHWL